MSNINDKKKSAEPMNKVTLLIPGIGFAAYVFSSGIWNIPIMAWIWPFAFLYYSRKTKTKKQFMLLAAAIVVGQIIKGWNLLAIGSVLDAALSAVLALCWVAVFAADRLLYNKFSGFVSTLLFPAGIVSMEFLRTFAPLGTFGAAAYTQAGNLLMMQIVSVIGTYGMSFLVMWFGSVLVHAVGRGDGWKKTSAVYAVIMVAVFAYGGVRMAAAPVDYSETVRVAGIVCPYHEKLSPGVYEVFAYEDYKAYLISGAERAAEGDAQIAAWNEASFSINDIDEADFLQTAKELSVKYNMDMVLPYVVPDTDDSEDGRWINKLVIITPDGSVTEYLKTKLVPLIEDGYYVRGTGQIPTVVTENAIISAVICFDDSYVSYVHGFGAETDEAFEDTEIFFAPSWDWDTVDKLHTEASEFRAIENGMSVVKPTYDGISTAVDHQGRVIARYDTEDTGFDSVWFADVPTDRTYTFYFQFGTVIDMIFGLSGLVMVIAGIVQTIRKNKKA